MKRLLIFFGTCLFMASCGSNAAKPVATDPIASETELPGKAIFTRNCKLCHGVDGTLGVSGAANLSISALTVDEKIQVITNGRRGMASFKQQLTPGEIRMVAEYVETLKR
jgi:mono/diheme cytochrome c family protein